MSCGVNILQTRMTHVLSYENMCYWKLFISSVIIECVILKITYIKQAIYVCILDYTRSHAHTRSLDQLPLSVFVNKGVTCLHQNVTYLKMPISKLYIFKFKVFIIHAWHYTRSWCIKERIKCELHSTVQVCQCGDLARCELCWACRVGGGRDQFVEPVPWLHTCPVSQTTQSPHQHLTTRFTHWRFRFINVKICVKSDIK